MASKLSIYNNALVQHLGARKLGSLSENRPSRKHLDAVWDGSFVRRVLEKGQWNQAIRTIESTYDPDYTSEFGYEYAHSKPSDWVRTTALSGNEDLNLPLRNYKDRNGFWECDLQTIYVSYVSDDNAFGGDIASWPESVAEYAEILLAARACRSITGDEQLAKDLLVISRKYKIEAQSVDQMNQPDKRPPLSSWASSRLGQGGRRGNINATGGLV